MLPIYCNRTERYSLIDYFVLFNRVYGNEYVGRFVGRQGNFTNPRGDDIKPRYTFPEVEGPTVTGERDQYRDLQADRDCRKRS